MSEPVVVVVEGDSDNGESGAEEALEQAVALDHEHRITNLETEMAVVAAAVSSINERQENVERQSEAVVEVVASVATDVGEVMAEQEAIKEEVIEEPAEPEVVVVEPAPVEEPPEDEAPTSKHHKWWQPFGGE